MTVYSQITGNKRRTYLIFFFFIVVLVGFFYLVGYFVDSSNTFLILGLLFSIFTSVVSYYNSDKIVLYMAGARPASKEQFFDLYTVVENLSMATGLPKPKVYVIDDISPNAFATGRDPKHAVVCATTGLLSMLDRGELEGVIAHELSHIKNYDILVATVVAVLVGTIAFISDWVLRYIWWGGSDSDRKERSPFLYGVFLLSLILMPITATLIQLAISRRREYLADASAVLITRNPKGLIDALRKISGYPVGLRRVSTSTAHLFIVNPFKNGKGFSKWLSGLFSTHPPVEKRIELLEKM